MGTVFLSLLLFILATNCVLHSVSIESKTGAIAKDYIKIENRDSIPVKVNFGNTKDKEFTVYFRTGCALNSERKGYVATFWPSIKCSKKSSHDNCCEIGENVKANHFSKEYISKFQRSTYFQLNANSNLRFEINSFPGEEISQSPLAIFSFYSLLVIPVKYFNNGKIEIDLYDTKNNNKIKTYTYGIEHRIYKGWLLPLVGVILPIFSERYDQSNNLNTYAIARVVFNEFEEDFIKDFNSDETLQKAVYLSNPPVYKIQKPTKEEIAKNPYLPYFLSKLESKLLQRGIEIIKQDDNSNNPSSVKADRVIKVDSLNILKDSINVNVSCSDLKNNKEVWAEKPSLLVGTGNIESTLDQTVDKLIENLVSKGEIN